MDIDPGSGLLGDVPDGGAAATDDGANHVAGDENSQGKVDTSGTGPALVRVPWTVCNVGTFAWKMNI